LIDHWLQPVRRLAHERAGELRLIEDPEMRANRLCECNVVAQVEAVAANPFVRDAWRKGQSLTVHGWVYSIQDGLLRDLEVSVSAPSRAPRRTP
jgi:carbonic anhydrase